MGRLAAAQGPRRTATLDVGALANLAILALWLFTRTIVRSARPGGRVARAGRASWTSPSLLDEVVLVAYVALIVRPAVRAVRGLRVLLGPHRIRLGMMLCSASFFAALLGGHGH